MVPNPKTPVAKVRDTLTMTGLHSWSFQAAPTDSKSSTLGRVREMTAHFFSNHRLAASEWGSSATGPSATSSVQCPSLRPPAGGNSKTLLPLVMVTGWTLAQGHRSSTQLCCRECSWQDQPRLQDPQCWELAPPCCCAQEDSLSLAPRRRASPSENEGSSQVQERHALGYSHHSPFILY